MPRLVDILVRTNELNSPDWEKHCQHFVIDNVAEYYYKCDKEYWLIDKDFPFAVPPFHSCWFEFEMPDYSYSRVKGIAPGPKVPEGVKIYMGGFAVKRTDVNDICQYECSIARFTVDTRTAMIIKKEKSIGLRYNLDENGEMKNMLFPTEITGHLSDDQLCTVYYRMHPILLALSLMHCSNTEIVEVEAPPKLQKARVRRNKPPIVKYSVINIVPSNRKQTKRKVETDSSGEASQVALHIRRGYFRKYGPKYGRKLLFGKYEGCFWEEPRVRGSIEAGLRVHEYEVKGPKK